MTARCMLCALLMTVLLAPFCLAEGTVTAAPDMKVALIIASSKFSDTEFSTIKQVLSDGGVNIVIVSSSLDTARGMNGLEVQPNMMVDSIDIDNYNALILVGGEGMQEYLQDEGMRELLDNANQRKMLIAAICYAPAVLARAGILRGKTVTGSPYARRTVRRNGGRFRTSNVITSGNIITGKGPQASKEFAETVLRALRSKR